MLANLPLLSSPLSPIEHNTTQQRVFSFHSSIHPSMAVQAQYPSNLLFLDNNKHRNKKENMEVDYNQQQQQQQQQQQHAFFFYNGDGGVISDTNPKKRARARGRGRDSQMAHHTHNAAAAATIALSQLHHPPLPPPPPPVSTGLRLSSDDSSFSDELSAQINLHAQELDQFLLAQGEQLRRTLAEKRRGHYRALLAAAEDSAAKRMREKDAELDRAARRTAELEDRLARLRTETMAWQAKAVADQAAAASLHAQLQQAAAAASALAPPRPEERGESPAAEDAGSACTDPVRSGFCRSCRAAPASVVLLPCRHLCLCAGCDAVTAGGCCPVCGSARTGSVPIFL